MENGKAVVMSPHLPQTVSLGSDERSRLAVRCVHAGWSDIGRLAALGPADDSPCAGRASWSDGPAEARRPWSLTDAAGLPTERARDHGERLCLWIEQQVSLAGCSDGRPTPLSAMLLLDTPLFALRSLEARGALARRGWRMVHTVAREHALMGNARRLMGGSESAVLWDASAWRVESTHADLVELVGVTGAESPDDDPGSGARRPRLTPSPGVEIARACLLARDEEGQDEGEPNQPIRVTLVAASRPSSPCALYHPTYFRGRARMRAMRDTHDYVVAACPTPPWEAPLARCTTAGFAAERGTWQRRAAYSFMAERLTDTVPSPRTACAGEDDPCTAVARECLQLLPE